MGHIGRYDIYNFNEMIVKQLGEDKLKVVQLSACRMSGYELDNPKEKQYQPKNSVNEFKLDNNIVRAKTKVNELALCNPWTYFITLTLDQNKYDRYNLNTFKKDLSEFIHNINRRRSEDNKIKYILIPEMHKDGAWHMHGLFQGLSENDLYLNSNGYRSWKAYENKFGYISIDTIKDKNKVSNYITKYITKDMNKNVTELGGHMYYASKGLNTAEVLYRGKGELTCPWDYIHPEGYCRIKMFDLNTDNYTDYLKLGEANDT